MEGLPASNSKISFRAALGMKMFKISAIMVAFLAFGLAAPQGDRARFIAKISADQQVNKEDIALFQSYLASIYSDWGYSVYTTESIASELKKTAIKDALGGGGSYEPVIKSLSGKGVDGKVGAVANRLFISLSLYNDQGGLIRTKPALLDLPVDPRAIKALLFKMVAYLEGGVDFDETAGVKGALTFGTVLSNKTPPTVPDIMTRCLPEDILSATASTVLPPQGFGNYGADMALDGKNETCWVNAKGAEAKGEWIEIKFKRPVKLTRVGMFPGYDRVTDDVFGDRFYKNARFARVLLEAGSEKLEAAFDDRRTMQFVEMKGKPIRQLRVTILEYYPGTRWQDVCLSEMEFWENP